MAGERIGKTYEALLKVALDRLCASGALTGTVFWNETPEGISVEPDFLVGENKNHPLIVIMVTHYNASKQSIMKYWRNLGELCEIKTALSPSPVAINIIFDSIMEESLKVMQKVAFDGQIIFGDEEYSEELQTWVLANIDTLPVNQNDKVDTIASIAEQEPKLSSLLQKMEVDLENCILNASQNLGQLWRIEKHRSKSLAPRSRTTCIRRGLSKLLVFEDIELGISLYRGKSIQSEAIPEYIFETSLAKKAIGKVAPTDPEILSAVKMLKDEDIISICKTADDIGALQNYLTRLRSTGNINLMGQYLINEYSELIKHDELYKRIVLLHNDPRALLPETPSSPYWPPADVWLVSYIIELIKTHTGKANGFGNQQLAKEVIECGFGVPADRTSASQFGGGFGFAAWMIRNPSMFKDELVRGVSFVLSNHLKEIGYDRIKNLVDSHKVQRILINNLIEAKLCTHPSFMPLFTLLSESVECTLVAIKTCFAEKAGLTGTAGNTLAALCNNSLIVWKTATNSGKDHKRKELCGKAVGLRYSWDHEKQLFIKRPGIEKLILLIDGTWAQKDLDVLVSAGWDEIYYPDEIDKLKAAIV